MQSFDVLVVGGGIAGLATAWHLTRSGTSNVCLIEREKILASHASGRNAAIFRQLDGGVGSVQLALRTRELLGELDDGDRLLRPTGALFVGGREMLEPLLNLARRFGVSGEPVDSRAVRSLVPALAGGPGGAGLFVPGDGVLDVHGLAMSLARRTREAGGTILTGTAVGRLLQGGDRVQGVRLDDGAELAAPGVVLAVGAWAGDLGATCGAPLPIEPYRRHLALLSRSEQAPAPVAWSLDPEVYFRPEAGGLLASPCDEDRWPPEDPPTSPDVLARLAERLSRAAPALATARVLRAWACVRSFASDRTCVAGPDPRVRGLTWIAGLGGRGMSCGLALGEVAAAAVQGLGHPLAEALRTSRLI
ncbi:MAG: FAD-binding oxidoreductase [Deltaproteobacteria bacterium]|nr:FAD-binding oxidoreductase [Deltaproteobacteria bacterium]